MLGSLRDTWQALFPPRWRSFAVNIVVPAVLAQALFVLAIFWVLIPTMERQLMDRKEEMIRELTSAAWSILDEYYQEELAGRMTTERAQSEAAERVRNMRYGEDNKDYYWITDDHPTMIVHPYREDLNGQDLSDFEDMKGKKLFVAFVQAVRDRDADYVEYYWQWKDDPNRIVPKLSYVRVFEPWRWIIGTGIYVEDVRLDIAATRTRLTYISLGIVGAIFLLLAFISRQSLQIERLRSQAEEGLRESNERYRALVEASTEGTLMLLEGRAAFSNGTFLDMLGYEASDLAALGVDDLLVVESGDGRAREFVRALSAGEPAPEQFEGQLRRKDGQVVHCLLNATRIDFAGTEGLVLTARDVTQHKEMQAALAQTSRRIRTISDAIGLGVLRSTWGRRADLIEANPAARRMLSLDPKADLAGVDWLERIADPEERSRFVAELGRDDRVENYRLGLRFDGGGRVEVSSFAVLHRDEGGQPRFCDAILEDVTEQRRTEVERESLIAQLQASLFFLQEPVASALTPAVTCSTSQTVARAASLIAKSQANAVLVTGPDGEPLGIVTDHDFRDRVVAAGRDGGTPIREVMSAPIVFISSHALVYEAILKMQSAGISHLVVKDDSGAVRGIVRHRDLIDYREYSSVILSNRIRGAGTVDDLVDAHQSLPHLVKALIDSGTRIRHVNRVISSTSDGVVERLLALAVEQIGPPPARFSFLVLGSEGREEQTLLTDQDNALVYEDPPDESAAECVDYFLKLGALVCDWLDEVGYAFCQGGVMAKNPRWNQPLSVWKQHFTHWIHNANPQELLELNMMFDFRSVGGDARLARDLREWVFQEMATYPIFFVHFAQNALLYRPPVGLFGNIVVGSGGDGAKSLNLKEAMMPVVNYARLYTLRHRIEETHTLDRLAVLRDRGILSRDAFEELVPTYEALMRMRLDHQAQALMAHRRPTNSLSAREWSALDEVMLKQAFASLANLRRKINYDFLGGMA